MTTSNWLAFIEPAQPVLVDQPPPGAGWIHEIRQEGFRTQLIVQGGEARAYSREGLDCSDRYAALVAAAAGLPVTSVILDGAVIMPNEQGQADIRALPRAILESPEQLVFVAFDLMLIDDEDLRSSPLRERRAVLEQLIKAADSRRLVFSRGVEIDGGSVFRAAQQLGLEAIVSKWANGRYRSGKRSGWQTTKCTEIGIFEVVGVDETASGSPVALLANGGRYAGQAAIALDQKMQDAFWHFVERRKVAKPRIPALRRRKTATWIGVGLTAKVKHLPSRESEILHRAIVLEITLAKARGAEGLRYVALDEID